MIGIEPGGTRTRSATRKPCNFEIADATSRLTVWNLLSTSSSESAALLELDDRDQLLAPIVQDGDRGDAAAGDLLDRRLDVVGIVVAPIDDQQILDPADDEEFTVGDDAQVSGPKPRAPAACPRDGSTSRPPKVRSDCCGFRQ